MAESRLGSAKPFLDYHFGESTLHGHSCSSHRLYRPQMSSNSSSGVCSTTSESRQATKSLSATVRDPRIPKWASSAHLGCFRFSPSFTTFASPLASHPLSFTGSLSNLAHLTISSIPRHTTINFVDDKLDISQIRVRLHSLTGFCQ